MGTDGTRHASGCTFHLWYWRGESWLEGGLSPQQNVLGFRLGDADTLAVKARLRPGV